jgi:integrase
MALRWKDIHWPRNRLVVSKSRWGKIEDSTKTEGSEREVFLPDYIKTILKDLQKKRKAKDNNYIVVNRDGQPYQIYLHKYWKDALKAAKVPYRSNYVLRSTFASLALQDGVDIAYISKTMGHTSIKVTADKYMRYLKDANKHNEAKLSKMLELGQ